MHPDDERLAALALGEPIDPADVEHVEHCEHCEAVVDELHDTLGLVQASEVLTSPPDSVWTAITDELRVPDQLALRRERRRPQLGWMAAAAAAGVIVGLAGTQVYGSLTAPSETIVAQARMDTLDTLQTGGSADLVTTDGEVRLRLQVDPLDAGTGFLEVWLINNDLKRMVSVGMLPNGVTQEDFRVTQGWIDQGFVIVDISREEFDDQPQHSGDSLLRGTLT